MNFNRKINNFNDIYFITLARYILNFNKISIKRYLSQYSIHLYSQIKSRAIFFSLFEITIVYQNILFTPVSVNEQEIIEPKVIHYPRACTRLFQLIERHAQPRSNRMAKRKSIDDNATRSSYNPSTIYAKSTYPASQTSEYIFIPRIKNNSTPL